MLSSFLKIFEQNHYCPSERDCQFGAKRRENCVVGFFLERRVLFPLVKRYMDRMWTNLGLEKITFNGQGMFIQKFRNGDDLLKIVKDGPWIGGGQPFFV